MSAGHVLEVRKSWDIASGFHRRAKRLGLNKGEIRLHFTWTATRRKYFFRVWRVFSSVRLPKTLLFNVGTAGNMLHVFGRSRAEKKRREKYTGSQSHACCQTLLLNNRHKNRFWSFTWYFSAYSWKCNGIYKFNGGKEYPRSRVRMAMWMWGLWTAQEAVWIHSRFCCKCFLSMIWQKMFFSIMRHIFLTTLIIFS